MYGSTSQFILTSKFSNDELDMIIGNKPDNQNSKFENISNYFNEQGLLVHVIRGNETLEGLAIEYNVKVNSN